MTLDQQTAFLKTLPNKLTVARIAAIPLLLVLVPFNSPRVNIFAGVIFAIAAFTDYLDGYLARKYNSVTPLGALLDPIADKMLVGATLVLIAANGAVPAFLAGLMLARDIGVSGIRLMAQEEGFKIEVNEFGKWKTFLQLIGCGCLLVNQPFLGLPFRPVGMIAMWVALALSLYSGWQYGTGYLAKTKNDPLGLS